MMLLDVVVLCVCVFFFKQKTAYEMRISDWSSDVCSSDLAGRLMADEEPRIRALRDRLLAGLQRIPDLYVNGSMTQRVAHNLNVSVAHIEEIGRASWRERVCQYV